MSYHGESNVDLSVLATELTDSELLRTRVDTIRQIGRLTDFLGILNEERRLRAPQDQEAVVVPLQRQPSEPLRLVTEGLEER